VLPGLLDRDAELAHFLLEILPVHADLLGRLGDVSPVTAERVQQEVALEGFDDALLGIAEGEGSRGGREGGRGRAPGGLARQIGERDLGARREQQRPLNRRA